MNPLEFLGIPYSITWTLFGIMLFLGSLSIYSKLRHKFSKQCRNCGKYSGKKILCDECYSSIKNILPNGWSNKK